MDKKIKLQKRGPAEDSAAGSSQEKPQKTVHARTKKTQVMPTKPGKSTAGVTQKKTQNFPPLDLTSSSEDELQGELEQDADEEEEKKQLETDVMAAVFDAFDEDEFNINDLCNILMEFDKRVDTFTLSRDQMKEILSGVVDPGVMDGRICELITEYRSDYTIDWGLSMAELKRWLREKELYPSDYKAPSGKKPKLQRLMLDKYRKLYPKCNL